jgi:hypothetical protein
MLARQLTDEVTKVEHRNLLCRTNPPPRGADWSGAAMREIIAPAGAA